MNGGTPPPHDLQAEAALLGTVIIDQSALDKVLETLQPTHFYSESHRRIYEACFTLHAESKPVDIVQVATWLKDRNRIDQIGGVGYLTELLNAAPAPPNPVAYAKTIVEKSRVRSLIEVCRKVLAEAYGDYGDAQAFIDEAEQAIYDIARTAESSSVERVSAVLKKVFKSIQDAAARGERITGIPTGFPELDALTAGLHDGDLTIVAGRPGSGKTSYALNVASNLAAADCGVVFFSLEMPREQLASRLICADGKVDVGLLRRGLVGPSEWDKLTPAAVRLGEAPFWVDDAPTLSVLELRAKIRRIQSEFDREEKRRVRVVFVDYLQLMRGHAKDSREQEVSSISRGLKALAKELKVSVVALSQLNRAVEGRVDKRPQLYDLRESGAIEQDADNVLFIYRDDYYNPESSREPGIAELILAKQRNGPIGTVKVRFAKEFTRFSPLGA
jgi:replicative DNA helicase